jgi:hypothetical protein
MLPPIPKPPKILRVGLNMRPGDIFEVEIEGMGILSNPVQDG